MPSRMLNFFKILNLPRKSLYLHIRFNLTITICRSRAETSSTKFLHAIPSDYHFELPSSDTPTPTTYNSELSKTRRLESERRHAQERRDLLLRQVLELEVQMGIAKRWTPDTEEYAETAHYIHERRYHQALNHLQRLVVQRLFELHRLNLSGIGTYPTERCPYI
jgi:hypothetical protein